MAFEISREYIQDLAPKHQIGADYVLYMYNRIIWEDQFLSFDQCEALKHEPHIDLCQKIVRSGISIKVDRING